MSHQGVLQRGSNTLKSKVLGPQVFAVIAAISGARDKAFGELRTWPWMWWEG